MSLTAPHRGLRRGVLLVLAVLVVVLAVGLVIAATTGGRSTPKVVSQHVVGSPAPGSLSDAPHALPPPAATAARAFLSGYIAYLAGHIPSGQIPDASPQVIAALGPKRLTGSQAAGRPSPIVVRLGSKETSRSVLHVTALISDGISRYPVRIVMTGEQGGWVTTQLLRAE